jgi:hypothetical protein
VELDIEAAFLEGDIDKPIYIEFPEVPMKGGSFVTKDKAHINRVHFISGIPWNQGHSGYKV